MKTMTQLTISFYLNNEFIQKTIRPEQTALQLIQQLDLTGTKESCSEGDCGACTIAVGRWKKERFQYLAINACIYPAAKLHGSHVITIEGLAEQNTLHLIQQLILENHATQCGFCTPGIIMSLFCFAVTITPPVTPAKPAVIPAKVGTHIPETSQETLRTKLQSHIDAALEGNLCRCTGYLSIKLATNKLIDCIIKHRETIHTQLLPSYAENIQIALKTTAAIAPQQKHSSDLDPTENYFLPQTIDELFSILEIVKSDYKIINGGTDLMVTANLHKQFAKHYIDITQITELQQITIDETTLSIGAAVTMTELLHHALIQTKLPILIATLSIMASNQTRNVASLAGNIANASPVGDGTCTLLALNAKLHLHSKNTSRIIALEDFFHDYKKTALQSGEIITKIEIPLSHYWSRFEKTSKRLAVDISSVSSALSIQIENNLVRDCRIAFSGIYKFPVIAKACCEYLIGKELKQTTIATAAKIAEESFTPLSDVRGSAQYRRLLIRNHVMKQLRNCCEHELNE